MTALYMLQWGEGQCNRENVVYKGQCLECKDLGKESVYIEETSRSGYVRGKQHLEAIQDHMKHPNNAFSKHIKDNHESRIPKFQMNVIKYYQTPLERQVREGIEIIRARADIIMNSKLDHYQTGMRNVTFTSIFGDQEFRS